MSGKARRIEDTMDDNMIQRINELYHKAKESGLTPEEKLEQADLRSQYIMAIRNNLRSQLNSISVLNPDGTVTELKDKDPSRRQQ